MTFDHEACQPRNKVTHNNSITRTLGYCFVVCTMWLVRDAHSVWA